MKNILIFCLIATIVSCAPVKGSPKKVEPVKAEPVRAAAGQVVMLAFDSLAINSMSIAIGTPLTVKAKFDTKALYYIPKYFCLSVSTCSACRNYVGFKRLY